ncbi:unnamed protein product [Allacma fusca]|uniref:WASH complex subunit strumpellin n=1 Tax=Allacma fusca TaxID=39272 RepID=A0A8J2L0I2_9HEXA|nr:unnamed protein product [Allacma fusca]
MSDFLADNNLCGQTILKLVGRGNAIIADLLRLKDNVPRIFRLSTKTDLNKYCDIISDLSYFGNPEKFEARIDKTPVLQELDEELRRNYTGIISQFYLLFESIYKYVTDLNRFIDDIEQGFYIQMTIESVLQNGEGKQLLAESLYLYGVILLLVDWHIEGIVRERMLTFFYRCSGHQHSSETNVDDVCKLLRSTGFTRSYRPPRYPEDYFGRVPINDNYVNMLIGKLRSDDLYNQTCCFPLPAHRPTALGAQAAVLFVSLWFAPKILKNQRPTMREITDKFFPDNWIIAVYIGFHVNLMEAWESFPAAKEAIHNTIDSQTINSLVDSAKKIPDLTLKLRNVLKEGVLTEENILERATVVLSMLREANVNLRWLLLHISNVGSSLGYDGGKKVRPLKDLATSFADPKTDPPRFHVLDLLLVTSQLELKVKELFRKLLDEKRQKWDIYKAEAKDRVKELAEVFGAKQPLTRIERNENLAKWLDTKSTQVDNLDFSQLLISGRKITELIRAFHEMLEFHSLESKVQVREWVNEIITLLTQMLRTGNINEEILVTVQIVGDFGYAWGSLIDVYTSQMQALIQKHPAAVSKLRAVFLKLSSAMDMPLLRLSQAKSPALVTVSSYYSGELVSFVQKVLQIIPEKVFSLLHSIIDIQTSSIKEIPTRLEKDKVKEFAQLEERHKVSELTHEMSLLTEGILMMQTTLVGIIRIEPKTLLENGIRKELVAQVSQLLNNILVFGRNSTGKEKLGSKLEYIHQRKAGIQRSFEYIGDYVHSYGLKIFQEEFARVINYAAEQDYNAVSIQPVYTLQSIYQSKDVPLPMLTSEDGSTFMGRLARELVVMTDARTSVYVQTSNTWHESKTFLPIMSNDTFALMEKALDITGMTALDKLLALMISHQLNQFFKILRKEMSEKSTREYLDSVQIELQPCSKIIGMAKRTYSSWCGKACKNPLILDYLLKIGQIQLLRARILYQLKVAANSNAKILACSVINLNRLLAKELKTNTSFREENTLLFELLTQSEPLGLCQPGWKIYLTSNPIQHISLYLTLVTVQQLQKLSYSKAAGTFTSRKSSSETLDGIPLVVGLSTVLQQLNVAQKLAFTSRICQYMNSFISNCTTPVKDDTHDLSAVLFFLNFYCRLNPQMPELLAWDLLKPSGFLLEC